MDTSTMTKGDLSLDLIALGDPPAKNWRKAEVQARWDEWRAAIDLDTLTDPDVIALAQEAAEPGLADDQRAVPDPTEGFPDLLPATVDAGATALQLPEQSKWQQITGMAEVLANSRLVPSALYRRPADVTLVLLTAHDLGIPSTMAFSKIHIMDSKPTMAAELMVALILREGHSLVPGEVNERSATARGQRKGSAEVVEFTFTMEDAERADLPKRARGSRAKGTYDSYPKAMLWARAVSGLARMMFPDVLCGVTYTPEELGAVVDVDEEGDVIVVDSQVVTPADAEATPADPDDVQNLRGMIGELTDDEQGTLRSLWHDEQEARRIFPLAKLRAQDVRRAEEMILFVAPRLDPTGERATDEPDDNAEPAVWGDSSAQHDAHAAEMAAQAPWANVESDDQARERLRAEGKCIACGESMTDNTRSVSDPEYHQSCEPF